MGMLCHIVSQNGVVVVVVEVVVYFRCCCCFVAVADRGGSGRCAAASDYDNNISNRIQICAKVMLLFNLTLGTLPKVSVSLQKI